MQAEVRFDERVAQIVLVFIEVADCENVQRQGASFRIGPRDFI